MHLYLGVPIAILIMCGLDVYVTDTYTQKVKVPLGFQPSSPEERGWFINPFGNDEESFSFYVALVALVPALLLFILVLIYILLQILYIFI